MKKAVIYARVSTKDQEREGYSIPAQIDLLTEYAKRKGFSIVKRFVESESAASIGRKEFNAMVQLLMKDESIESIIVFKIDRLFRNLEDRVIIDRLIYGHQKTVHVVNDNNIITEDTGPDELVLYDIKTSLARIESKKIGQRVKTALDQKAKQGKYPGGPIPIGYLRNKINHDIELDPERSQMVRHLYEMYATGEVSLDDIHEECKRMGLTYRKSGRIIARCETERILKRIFYTGRFIWKDQVVQGEHPAIVDTILYDRVQDVFKGKWKGGFSKKDFAFNRIIKCGECGNTITAQIKKGKYTYYHCTGYKTDHKIAYIPENKIDSMFARIVSKATIPYEYYEFLSDCLKSEMGKQRIIKARERERLELERDKIRVNMKKAYKDKLEGVIQDDFFRSVYDGYQEQLNTIEYRLSTLSESIAQRYDIAKKSIELSYQAESLYLMANPKQKRKLIKSLLSNCYLKDLTLYPTYKKPFNVFAEMGCTKNKRGGPHSPQTFVELIFSARIIYSSASGTRWKTIG